MFSSVKSPSRRDLRGVVSGQSASLEDETFGELVRDVEAAVAALVEVTKAEFAEWVVEACKGLFKIADDVTVAATDDLVDVDADEEVDADEALEDGDLNGLLFVVLWW